MTSGRKTSLIRRSHRWLGWAVSLLLVAVAGSGILLQHPRWLGPVANPPLSLAVDPDNGARLLRGTHWGVEVSEDGGHHWQEVPMLAAPTDVRRILFAPGGAGAVYAVGNHTVVVSRDGGRIWQDVAGPADDRAPAARYLDLTVSAAGELHLLTTAGQYRKHGDGDWLAIGGPSPAGRNARQWLHDLHTGHMWGPPGRVVVEAGAWALVVLVVTGLVLQRRVERRRRA